MRIDNNLKLRQVAGESIIIRNDNGVSDLNKVVGMNESSVDLFNWLKGKEFELDDVVRRLTDAYEVDAETARRDAAAWVEQMRREAIIID